MGLYSKYSEVNENGTLLSIDTSSGFCSVALEHDGQIFAEHELTEQSHSAHVLPMVRRVLNAGGLTVREVDALVVGVGPGGFTGVRLGVAVVQGLAYAADKPVVALSSLMALAQAAADSTGGDATVVVANDARMKQVYWAVYRFTSEKSRHDGGFSFEVLQAPSLGNLSDVSAWAVGLDVSKTVLAGNAWTVFDDFKAWQAECGFALALIDHAAPNAKYLLPIAQQHWAAGDMSRPHDVAPLYVRDNVAQTIAERAATAAQKLAALEANSTPILRA